VSLGSSTVKLHDSLGRGPDGHYLGLFLYLIFFTIKKSLGSRHACACSVVIMGTVLEECTTEEHRSFMRFFCGQKDSMQRIVIKKCFLFMV
jgi:hypothetical protein